jgi:hypothetical protein
MYEVIEAGPIEVRSGQVKIVDFPQAESSHRIARLFRRRLAAAISELAILSELVTGCTNQEKTYYTETHLADNTSVKVIPYGAPTNPTHCDQVEIKRLYIPTTDKYGTIIEVDYRFDSALKLPSSSKPTKSRFEQDNVYSVTHPTKLVIFRKLTNHFKNQTFTYTDTLANISLKCNQ